MLTKLPDTSPSSMLFSLKNMLLTLLRNYIQSHDNATPGILVVEQSSFKAKSAVANHERQAPVHSR